MHCSHLRAAALAFVLACTLAAPAHAQDSTQPTSEDAQKMAVEGLSKLLQALDLFVKSVPQYSAPEVLPDGDIIIRRVHPDQAPEAPTPPKGGGDSTNT